MDVAVSVLFAMAEYIACLRAWRISSSSYTGWSNSDARKPGWKCVDNNSKDFFASIVTPNSAVPDLCCIVTRRLVKSVGGVFDPVFS